MCYLGMLCVILRTNSKGMGHTFIIPLRLVLLLFNVMLHYILIFTLIIYVLVADNTYSLPLKEQLFKPCITNYFNLNVKFDIFEV